MKRSVKCSVVFTSFLSALVLGNYLNDIRSAKRKLSSYRTQKLHSKNADLEYLREGSGEPILISHGITGGFDQSRGVAKLYIGEGYDLICVSRFGYPGSPLPRDPSPKAQADAYRLLLDELNIDKAYIFGTSAGGTSALQFALRFPERCRGLILVSSNVPLKNPVKTAPQHVMKVVFGHDTVYWLFSKIMGMNMLPVSGTPKNLASKLTRRERLQLLRDVILSGLPISRRTKGILNDLYLSNPDINSGYPFEHISVPVLMIGAKDDPLCLYEGFETLRRKIKDVRSVSYETGGHLILGHEKEIQREISDFITLQGKLPLVLD